MTLYWCPPADQRRWWYRRFTNRWVAYWKIRRARRAFARQGWLIGDEAVEAMRRKADEAQR